MKAAFGLRPVPFRAPLAALRPPAARALFVVPLPAAFLAVFFAAFLAIWSPSGRRGASPRQVGLVGPPQVMNSRDDRSRPIHRLQRTHHQIVRVIGFLTDVFEQLGP